MSVPTSGLAPAGPQIHWQSAGRLRVPQSMHVAPTAFVAVYQAPCVSILGPFLETTLTLLCTLHSNYSFFFLPLMPFASQIWSAAIYRRFSCVFWIQTIQSDDESSHSKSCEAKPFLALNALCLTNMECGDLSRF